MTYNAIEKAIRDIFFYISREVLEMAFPMDYVRGYSDNRSLEQRVEDTIINQYVLPDINASTGPLALIHLGGLTPVETNSGHRFTIPLSETNGRKITNVISAEYASSNMRDFAQTFSRGGTMENMLGNLATSILGAPDTGTPYARLIGPNVVLVRDIAHLNNLRLRCQLEHESRLSNIPPHGYQSFSDLVLSATKIYISTMLNTRIGEGNINGGSNSGYLRSLVDEYMGEKENYRALKDEWARTAAFCDEISYNELLALQLPI